MTVVELHRDGRQAKFMCNAVGCEVEYEASARRGFWLGGNLHLCSKCVGQLDNNQTLLLDVARASVAAFQKTGSK